MWVRRIIELIGWEPRRFPVDWAAMEQELQFPLPEDYNDLFEAFGGGTFFDSVYFLGCDEGLAFDFLTQWRVALSVDQDRDAEGVSAVRASLLGLFPGGARAS